MTSPPLSASLKLAAQAVAAVLAGHTPDTVLVQINAALRPAVLDLAYTTLRDFGRGDFLLGQLLAKPLKDKPIQALLLVALARLERRPEEAHTLVDQAVTAAGKPFKGLVNAVLRNFLRRQTELQAAAAADDVAHWRHPAWWLDSLHAAYPAQWEAIATAGNSHPPMSLRINPRRVAAGCRSASADYCAELVAAGIAARALAAAALLLDRPLPVERLPGFREGRVSVQDWGAQQAARLLDVGDGQRVLDACAAPGGKTAHLLELADLDLTALELDPQRARRVGENLDRLGLRADIRVADARRPQDWWDGNSFDRILADVPCSASGVARRHPDIKWLRRNADVAAFAQAQAKILDALWPLLAPGGKMLYCTCSVFAAENELQMAAFATRHPDARRQDPVALQWLPTDEHDGFFFALLMKES